MNPTNHPPIAAPTERRSTDGREVAVLDIAHLDVNLYDGERYVPIVEDVSLRLNAGRTHGLVGESGSGKSVTALAVMGLLAGGHHPARLSGSICFDGRELLALDRRAMREIRGNQIAMIFQQPADALNPAYTIGNQLTEVIRLREAVGRRAAGRRATELLGHVGLSQPGRRLHDFPHQFSGGMLQRVMIAMALIGTPRILIADEPTTALDTTVQAQILALLTRVQEEFDLAVLFITHDLGIIAAMCDEVSVMYAGQIVEHRRTSPLFDRPAHPYLSALLQATPEAASTTGRELVGIAGRVPPPGSRPTSCRFAPRCAHAVPQCSEAPVALEPGANGDVRCVRAGELHLPGAT